MRAIDLFAGAGGFTAGAIAAGVEVTWAANHWRAAVEVHAANHPEVRHSCQDLMQADWGAVPDHDLLLASPACQGHSQAGQPGRAVCGAAKHDADRNTAWAVIGCAERRRPRAIVVENVNDFYRWPLFEPWKECLVRLGYTVREHAFDAADFGVPQNRLRAVITAGLDGAIDLASPRLPHVGVGDLIEWRSGNWAPISTKTDQVRKRVRKARARGLGARFISQHVTGHPGRELERPIGCITTKDQWCVVSGRRMRMLTAREYAKAQTFDPDVFRFPAKKVDAVRMIGNAIPPVFAEDLVRQVAEAL